MTGKVKDAVEEETSGTMLQVERRDFTQLVPIDRPRAQPMRGFEFPDRRGMAIQVIWRGDDVASFYTSHMTHGQGRHTQYGSFGKPTGRTYITRTVAECMILENRS